MSLSLLTQICCPFDVGFTLSKKKKKSEIVKSIVRSILVKAVENIATVNADI